MNEVTPLFFLLQRASIDSLERQFCPQSLPTKFPCSKRWAMREFNMTCRALRKAKIPQSVKECFARQLVELETCLKAAKFNSQ